MSEIIRIGGESYIQGADGSLSAVKGGSLGSGGGSNINFEDRSAYDSLIIGKNAGLAWTPTVGHYHVFLGNDAGAANVDGIINAYILGGNSNVSGSYNVAVGADSQRMNIDGSNNTTIGTDAMRNGTSIDNGLGAGRNALFYTQTDDAFGIGSYAGEFQTSGAGNSFLGSYSGRALTTANRCTLIGNHAGYSGNLVNTTGDDLTAIGYYSFQIAATGRNTGIGGYSGYNSTSVDHSTFVGYQAGFGATSSYGCTFIGDSAGYDNQTGHYNIGIGLSASPATATGISSSIAIGIFSNTTASNQCVIGSNNSNGSITQMYLGQGVTKASPAGITVQASGGSGTDNAGANLTLAAGKSTGSATPAVVSVQIGTAGASGTTLQTLSTMLTVSTVGLTINSPTLMTTTVALTNGAASSTGSLTNAPAVGNPTKWIPINDNGTTRYLPAW